jgi:YD repeat-containing protein
VSALSVTYYDKTLVPPATVTRTVVENVAYHPFGGVASFTFGNGQTYSKPRDLDGRIASYRLGGTEYSLGYDDASRLTGLSEVGNPGNVNAYGYDVLDRLTSAVLPATTYGYSYDATGNRLTKSAGAGTDTYAYPGTSNRLSSITPSSGPARTYVHDAVGSVTEDGKLQNVYDVRGRLIQSTNLAACLVAKFRVSALGQRVRKTVTTCDTQALVSDTLYVYDLAGHLIAETTPTGQYKRAYIHLGDIPVGMSHESYD